MAELSVGGNQLANQRVIPADSARAPAVGSDPNSPKQSSGNETTSFQRLSATEKTSLDVLSDLRQKGAELGNIYKQEQTIKSNLSNPTAQALADTNKANSNQIGTDQIAKEISALKKITSEIKKGQIEIIAGQGETDTDSVTPIVPVDNAESRQQKLEALAGGSQNVASAEFGPEEALREAEVRQSARELEQAILEVSKLASENGEGSNVAGGNFEGYIANLNNLRVAAQNPDANIELARQTREDILQNAQLAALSVKNISADVAQATIE